jgi:hypothetical protein
VEGHQQTAQMMQDDILSGSLPIATGPAWGVPAGPGLGIQVDLPKLAKYANYYRENGQFLPNERRVVQNGGSSGPSRGSSGLD